VHDIKQDTMAKAKHLLADQKAQFERTAQHYEQVARDEVSAQVAHNKAELVREALSVIGERDQKIAATTSQLADLRMSLDQANVWAQAELTKASQQKSETSGALTQQKD
jgi:F0F1-type ATP synthase membrane subunit b/b'